LLYGWRRAIEYELQAPLYFAVLALWRELNTSVWFARLFSILCATGFFIALGPILRRVAPQRRAFWAALFIALNPFVLYTAFDIRLYAPALLLSALGWLAFEAGFVSGRGAGARFYFVVLGIVSLYTQYFLGFALVGYAATLVATGRFRSLASYAATLVPIALAGLPLLGIVRSQIGGSGETTASATSLLRQTLVHPWLDFVLPYDSAWNALHARGAYVALVFVAIVLIAAARPRRSSAFAGALACAATIELLFVTVVLVFRLDLDTRHYVVLFVPSMIAGYALVTAIEDGPWPQVGRLFRYVYVLLTVAALYAAHHQVAQDGDSKRVAAYLEAHASPQAVIAVFPADALPAYARQYRGGARLVPFPQPLGAKSYDISAIDVRDEAEALAALARLRGAPQAWLVMLGSCDSAAAKYGCHHVLAAIADGSRVRSERRFYDSRVFALMRVRAAPERHSGPPQRRR